MKTKIITVSLLVLGLLAGWIWHLPSYLTPPETQRQVLLIQDRHGLPIKAYGLGETYDWVSLNDVPKDMIQMILLAEDKNYYDHHGVDFLSLLRSSWINLRHLRIRTGASTITQQVYRLHHQTPRTFSGKLRTIFGALKVDYLYPKETILAHYLNSLPYGKQVAGIKRASEVFFEKPLSLLSLAEMATLAVLPRSPSHLQGAGKKHLLIKRNALLENYSKTYALNHDVLQFEKKTELTLNRKTSGWDNFHFVSSILKRPDLHQFVESGKIETTLDLYLQNDISEILSGQLQKLKSYNVQHGAVIVLDNKTGDVLSYVGSGKIDQKLKGSFFDALSIKRQPGSTLKPFTYALALQKGRNLSDTLPDIPSYYKTGLGQYLPRNYDKDFSGPRLMREALANSLNLPAVALADELGVVELHQFLRQSGLELQREPDHYGVGLTLGNAEVSPIELAKAYSGFAFGESRIEPRIFLKDKIRRIPIPLTQEASFLIRDVLSDEVARVEAFGEGNVFDLPFEVAVKTGTSTDFRDNWAVGVNQQFTVVTWVGNMDQAPMKKVSGITGAGPVLADVFKIIMKGKNIPLLSAPSQIKRKEICALSGRTPGPHCSHKKMEYFHQEINSDVCDFHQELIVKDCREPGDEILLPLVVYPDAYQSFVSERPKWSLDGQVGSLCQLDEAKVSVNQQNHSQEIQIRKPLSGSIYAIDPNIPAKLQKLKIELNRNHEIKSVRWKLNGKEFSGKHTLDWPMEKGKHAIEASVELIDGKIVNTEAIAVTIL